MPKGLPEGFQWLDAEPDTRFSGYPAQDTPVVPTYRDYPTIEQTGGIPYKVPIPESLGYATHRPQVFLGRTMEDVPGLVKPGTIDLTDPFKPTQDAFSIEDGGRHVVLPKWGDRDAMIAQYKETGQSFGTFKDAESADAYTKHLAEFSQYEVPKPYGLGVIGENALGQPTTPKTGIKLPPPKNGKFYEEGEIGVESQESIKAKDRQVGMIEPPNIDLDKIQTDDLFASNASGESFQERLALNPVPITDSKKRRTVLIPTIIDGKQFPVKDAVRDYEKTGKHLGVFKDPFTANEYLIQLQARQAQLYGMNDNVPTQFAEDVGQQGGRPELAPSNLAPEEKSARTREQNPYPLPTVLSPETGKMEEVDPRWANARGIPIGMPRPGGGGPRPTGGPEYPAKEGQQAMIGDPGLLASAERRKRNEMSTDNPGMPEGFQWLGADDPAAQAAQQAGGGYEHGIASTFGYNDPEDNGIGAWGDITDDPNAYGVALPVRQLREMFGDPDKAYGAIVELTNPHTGQTVRAPILDKGPAEWVLNRQGPTIDVTEGVRRQMGLGGKNDMVWRVLGHGFPSDNPVFAPGGALEGFQWLDNTSTAGPSSAAPAGAPEGFQWMTGDQQAVVPGGKGTPIAPPSEEESNRLIEAEQAKPTPSEDRINVPELDQRQPQAPAQQPVRDQKERAANRQRLIDAIQTSEDAGYPVPHTIGTPEEPEGDRGPTQDMEHLVEALKLAEEDAKASNEKWQATQIGKERAYWEDHIKLFGMTADQAAAGEAKAAAQQPVYTQGPKPKGMLKEGNLDINNRKVLKNPDGTISTESSMSNQDEDGKEVLIPTVIDGVRYSERDAWKHYKQTGENLGKFDSPEAANAYAKTLHQRGYTEEQKKAEDARNQIPQGKAGVPRYSLSQEMAFAKAGERHSRGLGAKDSELPTLTPQEADKLGLKSWMDPSGTEVRRATLPDVMRARRAKEIGDQPYEMGFNTYAGRLKGMSSKDMIDLQAVRNSWLFKARVAKGEKEEEILKNVRNDVGTQAVFQLAAGINQALPSIPAGTAQALASITRNYQNAYLDKTPQEAAAAIPGLQKAVDLEQKRLNDLTTSQTGAGPGAVNTTAGNYPAPAQLPGKVTTGERMAPGGYPIPTEAAGNIRSSIKELANLKRQLAYAQERASGATPTEGMAGKVSRYFAGEAKVSRKEQAAARGKMEAFLNEDIVKRGPISQNIIESAQGLGGTIPTYAMMIANPYIGAIAFSAQQYDDSFQEAKKGGKTDEEAQAYAFKQQEQMPWEVIGDYGAAHLTKLAWKQIALSQVKNVKDAVNLLLKTSAGAALSEMITQPAQTIIQETGAEEAGLQDKTSMGQKAAKAWHETILAGEQGALLGGGGAALGLHQVKQAQAARQAAVIEHIKGAIAQRKAEEQTPYAQGGVIPSVAGPSTKSTGLFPSQATPSTAAPAPPPNLTQRFNDLPPDARSRVQAVPLMHWDQAIKNEEANIAAAAAAGTGPITPPAPSPEVEGPTTDEELEKMKQDYLGGPAAASAVARSLGARSAEEEKHILTNDVFPHIIKLHKAVQDLGADFVIDHGDQRTRLDDRVTSSGVVKWDDSGGKLKARLIINPSLLLSRTVKSSIAPGGESKIIGGEELWHLADIMSLGKIWEKDQSADHRPGGFYDYLEKQSENELKDVENAVMSAPAAERDSLLQGLSDIHHIYLGDYTAPSGLPANRDIFKAIRSDPRNRKNNTFKFIFEAARMVAQQKSQGLISEHTARNIWKTLHDYYNQVLARISNWMPQVEKGAYGPLFQAHVQRMQDQMAQWEAEMKLQGKKPIMPQLTPEEKARVTAEKPHAAYERPPPAPKSLKQAMQETFGTILKASLGGKRKETREEMIQRLRDQGMIGAREGEKPRAGLVERMKRLGLLPGQGVHFQPAVKIGDKVIAGASHFDAVRNAKKIGYSNEEIMRGTVGNLDENHKFKPFESREQELHKETSARAMGLATREGAATLNIGMNTDDGKGLGLEEILQRLEETGAGVKGYRVAPSATEPTVVAYLNRTLDPEEAYKLSKDLRQQAIAEKFVGGADLYGPAAAAWRPFNEDFFLASRAPAPELARSLDELEYLAKHYEEHKLWYEKFSAFLDSVLGANHEYKPLIMDFIAATSPGTNIGPNVRQAVDKLRQFMEEGTVTYHGLGHWPGAKLPNLRKAIEGLPLGGPKVSPFSEALKGDPRSAAIDRHVAMILFNTRKPTDAQIRVGQQAARDIAERLGWTPREVQAAWWAAGKEMFGAQPGERAKIVETYEQYLKEYQDELNSILTKDREGPARGLQAARAISARAGQRAGVAGGGRGLSLGTRAGEKAKTKYPGEVNVSDVDYDGRYWMDRDGRVYDVENQGNYREDVPGSHRNYAELVLGMSGQQAQRNGWVRVVTMPGDLEGGTVYWDGDSTSNVQARALKDIAAGLGYQVERDTGGTFAGLGTREREKEAKYPDEVDINDVEPDGAYWMDRDGRVVDVDATAGSHEKYAEMLGKSSAEMFSDGWIRVVPIEEERVYWNKFSGEPITNAQRRAIKDMSEVLDLPSKEDRGRGFGLGTRAGPEDLDKEQAKYAYQASTPEERNLPRETALSNLNKTEGGYWLSPSGRLYNVRAGTGFTHYEYARDQMGMSMPEAFRKGWARVLTFGTDKMIYWDGSRLNNVQSRMLKDMSATLGYEVMRDQDYTQRAALGLGTRPEVAENVKVDASETRKNGGYWMDRSGNLYDVEAAGMTHKQYAEQVIGLEPFRAVTSGWTRIRGYQGRIYYVGFSLTPKQHATLNDMGVYLNAKVTRATGLEAREGELGTRQAEKPVIHPLIGRPFKFYKTTLEGQKFAPHMTRSWWDWVGMHRFYSSTARVFDRLKGVEYMGPAIRKFYDRMSAYRGEFLNRAAAEFKKAPRHIMEEYRAYWINNQFRGRNFADNQPISPQARKLVDLSKDLFREMGDRARGKIRIYDPKTKTWRPFQPLVDPFRDYHPHILRDDIRDVLHNAASDPEVWNELQADMIKEGIIPGIDPDAEMTKHISNLLDKFTVNGFFGSLERSRTADYPTRAYDFSAKALFNYIDAWAERMAQTEAFGQGVGGQKTLWDKAIQDAGNQATIDFAKHVRNRIYGLDTHSLMGRAVSALTRFAVGEQLGSFFYTGRNLVFGTAFNWQHYGTLPFSRSVLNLLGTFRDIREAKEKGIVLEDIMNVQRDGGRAGWTGKWASTLLRIHGNNQVESWLRGTAMGMAKIALRTAIRRYGKNPRGMRVRQFIGYLDNLGFKGFEPHNLLMENGTGPLTDRYLRASVKAAQGGYTIAETTLFADSPEGRFWLLYSKFGLERIQDFALNVSKPFLRQIRAPGTKQVVILPDKNGNPENVRVPAGFVPMIRYLMVLGGAGAGWEWIAEHIFGIHARTASWAEIFAAMDENQGAAFADLAEKMFSYLIQAGAFGLVGNYAQMGMDITQRVNFKSPLDPAALQPLKDLGQEFLNFLDQGPPTSIEDAQARVDKFIEKSLSGYKRIKQFGAHVLTEYEQRSPGGPLPDDVFGFHRSLELAARRADFNLVRAATHRYDREIGTRANVRSPGVFGKNMESDFRDQLFEDLVLGDTQSASKRIEEHFKDWEPARQAQELKNLQQSVADRQPVKAGAGGGDREAGREDFLRWAERRLPEDQVAILQRVDKTYRETAQAIQYNGKYLMRADQLVPEMRIEKAMQRIKMMQR